MMEIQPFKANDQLEAKVRGVFDPVLLLIDSELNNFYEGAYTAYPLGDVLFVLKRSPLASVITETNFRAGFYAIHELFTRPGTFEFYLDVFRAIFGDDVEVEFTIPQPGVLYINIQSLNISLDDFAARKIVNNAYEYDLVTDHNGNQLVFQGTRGIKTQNEIDALMNELHPGGVYTVATLVLD